MLGLDPGTLSQGLPLDGPTTVFCKPSTEVKRYLGTLFEQVVNSAIVAGITALSMMAATLDVSLRAVGIAFGLTLLIELRKYRKMSN